MLNLNEIEQIVSAAPRRLSFRSDGKLDGSRHEYESVWTMMIVAIPELIAEIRASRSELKEVRELEDGWIKGLRAMADVTAATVKYADFHMKLHRDAQALYNELWEVHTAARYHKDLDRLRAAYPHLEAERVREREAQSEVG